MYGGGVRGMMGKSAQISLASIVLPSQSSSSEHQSLISLPLTISQDSSRTPPSKLAVSSTASSLKP